jgi:hypothetical protein
MLYLDKVKFEPLIYDPENIPVGIPCLLKSTIEGNMALPLFLPKVNANFSIKNTESILA